MNNDSSTPSPAAGERLSNARIRQLKAEAQRLRPVLHLGKAGATPAFIQSLDAALATHSLVKIKFLDFKDTRHEVAEDLAVKTRSQLIWVVGHVAVFFRPMDPAPPRC